MVQTICSKRVNQEMVDLFNKYWDLETKINRERGFKNPVNLIDFSRFRISPRSVEYEDIFSESEKTIIKEVTDPMDYELNRSFYKNWLNLEWRLEFLLSIDSSHALELISYTDDEIKLIKELVPQVIDVKREIKLEDKDGNGIWIPDFKGLGLDPDMLYGAMTLEHKDYYESKTKEIKERYNLNEEFRLYEVEEPSTVRLVITKHGDITDQVGLMKLYGYITWFAESVGQSDVPHVEWSHKRDQRTDVITIYAEYHISYGS